MLLNEMLLLEDSGNLRKLSPTVLKYFIKCDHDGNIGSNSVIRILPYNKTTNKNNFYSLQGTQTIQGVTFNIHIIVSN